MRRMIGALLLCLAAPHLAQDGISKGLWCKELQEYKTAEPIEPADLIKISSSLFQEKSEFETIEDYKKKLRLAADSICDKYVFVKIEGNIKYNAESETFSVSSNRYDYKSRFIIDREPTNKVIDLSLKGTIETIRGKFSSSLRRSDMVGLLAITTSDSKIQRDIQSSFHVSKSIAKETSSKIELVVCLKLSSYRSDWKNTEIDKNDNSLFFNPYTAEVYFSFTQKAGLQKIKISSIGIGADLDYWFVRNSATREIYSEGNQ